MGPPHVMHEERELSQTLHMASEFIPTGPLQDSQSLFDPDAAPSWEAEGMRAARLVSHFKSHILSLRTRRSRPLDAKEFHMQK